MEKTFWAFILLQKKKEEEEKKRKKRVKMGQLCLPLCWVCGGTGHANMMGPCPTSCPHQ